MRGGQGSGGAASNARLRRAAAEAIARAQARQALEARSQAYETKLSQQQAARQAARRRRADTAKAAATWAAPRAVYAPKPPTDTGAVAARRATARRGAATQRKLDQRAGIFDYGGRTPGMTPAEWASARARLAIGRPVLWHLTRQPRNNTAAVPPTTNRGLAALAERSNLELRTQRIAEANRAADLHNIYRKGPGGALKALGDLVNANRDYVTSGGADQKKRAAALGPDKAVVKSFYEMARHDYHHPISVGAGLDAASVLAGGYGLYGRGVMAVRDAAAAARAAEVARAAGEAVRISPVRAAGRALLRKPQAAEVLPTRWLPSGAPGGARSGLRYVRLGQHYQQDANVSPGFAWQSVQHGLDRLSEKIPEVRLVGARARTNRLIQRERLVEKKRGEATLIPLSEAARALQGGTLERAGRKITRLPTRNVSPSEAAWQHVADYGYVGEQGAALLDREVAQLREAAAATTDRAAKATLLRRIRVLQGARPHVLNPTPELLHSLELSKPASEAVTASRIGRRVLHPETAAQAPARKIRFLYGAEHVSPTDARRGIPTANLKRAQGEQERRAALRERAAEKARKLEFTGEQRGRLGLKSDAMARKEQQLGIYADSLRGQIKAAVKGTDEELQARADAIEARFQRVVDKMGGKGKHKTVNVEQQRAINAESKKRGRMTLSDELRKQAEQRVLDLIARNSHVPWARKEQGLLDEAAAIRDELSARADRKLGGVQQLHPKLPALDHEAMDATMQKLGAHELDGGQQHRPDLYMKHPKSGMLVRNEKPKPTVVHKPGEPPRIVDTVPAPHRMGNEVPVPGSERPPKYLYRAVSEEEYQAAKARGYFKSDERMNLAPTEGTVAALTDPTYYLPGKLASSAEGAHPGRVIRIRYHDADGWKLGTDGYVKTQERIPFERVDAAPEFVTKKGKVRSSVTGNPVEHISSRPVEPGTPAELILHPHLPTTHDALKYELQRVTQEQRQLAGRTRELPVGMPDTHALRAEVRVAEKALRKLEAEWNAPAADVIEQRAHLHRALRGGTGAERALAFAKGAPATEQGLAVTGIEDLRGRIDQLTEHIDELRGESPQDLRDLREHVKEMRSELRKLERPRAHVVPGDLPYAVTAKGDVVHPHGYERAVKLGAAQSVGADKLQGLEKAAEGRVTPVGLVTPPHLLPAHATRKEAEKALDAALKDAGLTRKEAGIRRVVTTADGEPDELTGAAFVKDGMAEATHVTDDPSVLMHVLERGLPIEQRAGDLGVGGLHVSDAPQVWTSRARGKWDFVGRITEGERHKLATDLGKHVNKLLHSNSVTAHEYQTAMRAVDDFRDGKNHALMTLANQPYNIDSSRPEFLNRLGIEAGTQPTHVPVHLQGSFAQLEHSVTPEALAALKSAGFDGAFTKGGMSTTPQMVVWNNKAIKSFGKWEAPVPHEVQPGPLALHTPDVAPRSTLSRVTQGRVSSLNPKREVTYASTGALRRAGRQQIGPGVTIREAASELKAVERQRVGAKGIELGVPFDRATYNEKQWQLMDTLAATPAHELPFGTKARIAADKRAAAEMPIQLEDVNSPGDLLAKIERERQAWLKDTFPASPGAVPEEHVHGLRMIRRSTYEALTQSQEFTRSENPWVRGALGLLDFSNKLNRAALIYLTPSYGPVQGTGNLGFLAMQQGPFAVANIPIYARRLTQVERGDRTRMDIEVGGGAAAHLAHERGGSGPLTHLADFQNAIADQQPRRIAWLHEADRMGYTTPKEIHALLNEEKLKPYLNVVSERAQQAMVKFERVPNPVRRAVGRAIFIAPWLEGSTRWLGRTILDRPLTAAAAEHLREKIIAHQKQRLGVGKAVTGGFIPFPKSMPFGLGKGGPGLIPGINPDAISLTGSGIGVAKAVGELIPGSGVGPPIHGGSRLFSMAQPTWAAASAALTRTDPYSGFKYPASRSPESIVRQQLLGDTSHPAVPLLATLATGLLHQKPSKNPIYAPEHGWGDVAKRLALGSLRPRNVVAKSAEKKGLAAEYATATGAKKKRLDVQKAMQKGRDERNTIDANARRYGLPGAAQGLPPDVRNAIRLRTARRVNYAHTGAKTQAEMFKADNAQLLRWGKITPATYASQVAWLATNPSKRQIEHRRTVAGRLFYGGSTLAHVHKQINAAADKRHGSGAPSGVVPTDSGPASVTQLVWGH